MTTALQTRPAARGRHLAAAVLGAAAAAAVVLAPGVAGDAGRVAAVLLVQAGLVAGWVLALRPAGAAGGAALAVAAAVAADLLVVGADEPGPGLLLVVAGPALLAAVVHQMLRRPPRSDVVGSLGSVATLVAAVCALSLLLLPEVTGDADDPATSPLLVVAAALAAGHLVDAALPRPPIAEGLSRGVPGLLAAAAAGTGVALLDSGTAELVDVLSGLTTGLVLGIAAALAGVVASSVLASVVLAGTGTDTDTDADAEADATAGRRVPGPAAVAVEALLPLAACAPALLALTAG